MFVCMHECMPACVHACVCACLSLHFFFIFVWAHTPSGKAKVLHSLGSSLANGDLSKLQRPEHHSFPSHCSLIHEPIYALLGVFVYIFSSQAQ